LPTVHADFPEVEEFAPLGRCPVPATASRGRDSHAPRLVHAGAHRSARLAAAWLRPHAPLVYVPRVQLGRYYLTGIVEATFVLDGCAMFGVVFPDMELVVSQGLTVGQQLPRFRGATTRLAFWGGVIPTRAHLRAPGVMAYDLHPLTTLEERRMLVAQALEDDDILFSEHDHDVADCRLREEEGQPAFREAVAL